MSTRNNDFIGDQIRDLVESAINASDYSKLAQDIKDTVVSAFEEIMGGPSGSYNRSSAGTSSPSARGRSYQNLYGQNPAANPYSSKDRYHFEQTHYRSSDAYKAKQVSRPKSPKLLAEYSPETVKSIIATGAGGAGTLGFASLLGGAVGIAASGGSAGPAIGFLIPLLGVSIGALIAGIKSLGRGSRFKIYKRVIGDRTYCDVKELAQAVGKSEEFVRKELKTMINKKYFLKGRLDDSETCLMLDDESYSKYLQARESYRQAQREKAEKEKEDARLAGNTELVNAIEEGQRYIRQIHEANEAIPAESISLKLDRMEDIVTKIFEVLKEKPDQLPRLRKFMKYYMPTTIKLVEAYKELDSQPEEVETIIKSKKEIEDTIDTINAAYVKLLDSFYEESAIDVKSDISVLQSMLAQEGLTNKPF
ncbi:MAG: 5-bromo-4-chloroindolyl phosphate hydrolysis family protein [Lachnospiraceae bacterium]|nr:5-bromo-4-chloroindolyl phosphate hydrolysis family protein [Lachnospiraceae bacterium]